MDSSKARERQVLQSPDGSSAGQTSDERLQLDILELAYLAAKAFEDNRRKECLALLRVILNLDPQNKDACDMQSRIRSDLERDLDHVRSLVPSLPKHENSYAMSGLMPLAAGVRKLQGVLDIDPENEAAQALLQWRERGQPLMYRPIPANRQRDAFAGGCGHHKEAHSQLLFGRRRLVLGRPSSRTAQFLQDGA